MSALDQVAVVGKRSGHVKTRSFPSPVLRSTPPASVSRARHSSSPARSLFPDHVIQLRYNVGLKYSRSLLMGLPPLDPPTPVPKGRLKSARLLPLAVVPHDITSFKNQQCLGIVARGHKDRPKSSSVEVTGGQCRDQRRTHSAMPSYTAALLAMEGQRVKMVQLKTLHTQTAKPAAAAVSSGTMATASISGPAVAIAEEKESKTPSTVKEITAMQSKTPSTVKEITAMQSKTPSTVKEITAMQSKTPSTVKEITAMQSKTPPIPSTVKEITVMESKMPSTLADINNSLPVLKGLDQIKVKVVVRPPAMTSKILPLVPEMPSHKSTPGRYDGAPRKQGGGKLSPLRGSHTPQPVRTVTGTSLSVGHQRHSSSNT